MLLMANSPKKVVIILAVTGLLGVGILIYLTWLIESGQTSQGESAAQTNQLAVSQAVVSTKEQCEQKGEPSSWCEEKQECIHKYSQNCIDIPIDDYLTDSSELADISGLMLYIQDGDVWKSDSNGSGAVKLIDRDAVTQAIPAPDASMIAYTIVYPSTETVKNSDGTEEIVELTETWGAKRTLYVADEVGANTHEVQEQVGRWGWVPNTRLIWYETSSLYQYFAWGYFGDNNLWVYDPSTNKSTLVRQSVDGEWGSSVPLLGIRWSPDGSHASFVTYDFFEDGETFQSLALHVVDRVTAEELNLLLIPWVGGDRGGPPPIPSFFWSEDSTTIYTGFTPVIQASYNYEKIDYLDVLKSNYISVLDIPINGQPIQTLFEPEPSIIFADESPIHLDFSEDRSKVLYFSVKSDRITEDSADDWVKYGDDDANIVVRDLQTDTIYPIDETYTMNRTRFQVTDDSVVTHITNEGIYWFNTKLVDATHWLTIYYFDFNSDTTKEIISIPAPFNEDNRLELGDISFLTGEDAILFRAGTTVFKVVNDQIGSIVENVDDVAYYSL